MSQESFTPYIPTPEDVRIACFIIWLVSAGTWTFYLFVTALRSPGRRKDLGMIFLYFLASLAMGALWPVWGSGMLLSLAIAALYTYIATVLCGVESCGVSCCCRGRAYAGRESLLDNRMVDIWILLIATWAGCADPRETQADSEAAGVADN
jgi:hypothetical protein